MTYMLLVPNQGDCTLEDFDVSRMVDISGEIESKISAGSARCRSIRVVGIGGRFIVICDSRQLPQLRLDFSLRGRTVVAAELVRTV